MKLTIAEIKDLAEFAGLVIDADHSPSGDDLETEIVIADCPEDGLDNEDGSYSHYSRMAYLDEYPEEGACGLGPKVKPDTEMCPRCLNLGEDVKLDAEGSCPTCQ